jgi:hypothetical protein
MSNIKIEILNLNFTIISASFFKVRTIQSIVVKSFKIEKFSKEKALNNLHIKINKFKTKVNG